MRQPARAGGGASPRAWLSTLATKLVSSLVPVVVTACLAPGCAEVPPLGDEPLTAPMAVGESRSLELRFLRFDVSNFTQVYTKKDLLELPPAITSRVWLLDIDLSNGPSSPKLLDNALAAIKKTDPATLTPASRNLQRLMLMTPATADLSGTSLEQLTALAPLLGIAPEKVLADLTGVNVDDPFLSSAAVSTAMLENVIGSHPRARTRFGPVTPEHPDGVYEVPFGFLPLTLLDAASDCATLADRFGPVDEGGVVHPGFIAGTARAVVMTDDFRMTLKANANALPYKGVELGRGAVASVNSIPSQLAGLFDFDDPSWLTIEGLAEGEPRLDELTIRIAEGPAFYPGGRSPLPQGRGDSPAWKRPAWEVERVVLDASRAAFSKANASIAYGPAGSTDPLFTAKVVDGWADIAVKGNVGSPPPPSYLWDFLLEAAQVRLHDGGLAEGAAGVEFTLRDVAVGTDTSTLTATLRENLKANPQVLLDVASRIVDNSRGEADFYYYRPGAGAPPSQQGDWLFFVAPTDVPRGDDGQPSRPYDYTAPGFFADAKLSKKVSTTVALDGDVTHEKARVEPGDTLYAQGAGGAVFRVAIGDKPSQNRCRMTVTRVK